MQKKPTGTAPQQVRRTSGTPVHRTAAQKKRLRELKRRRALRRRIGLGAALLAIIVLIIMLISRGCSGGDDVVLPPVNEATLEPTATAEPTRTPRPTVNATAQPIQYLPVITTGNTSEKKICITVDDCFQVNNLNKLLDICASYGQKITLFPIGHVVYEKADLRQTLLRAWGMGMEIENHTYSHSKLYSMDDADMAADIMKQNMAVNLALDVDYEMHFLRMMGGNGEEDLRSHQYLIQLGNYKAIAHWGYSGSDASLSHIKKNLKPGQIYLFHTTDDDFKKLKEFIPYVVSQGYEMITLNEMFGLEPNAFKALTGDPLKAEIPVPLPFVYTEYLDITENTRTHMYAVRLLQERLQELGYLSDNVVCDGAYGATTKAAVIKFQSAAGLTADGYAGKLTQTALFSDDAPRNPGSPVEPQK